jgi:hypothetical protein
MYLSFQKTGPCNRMFFPFKHREMLYRSGEVFHVRIHEPTQCSPPSSLILLTRCIFAGLPVWSAAKRWKTLARCWHTSSPSCQRESCPQPLSPFPTRRKHARLPQASNSSATTPVSRQAPRPLQLCGVMMWLQILRQPHTRALSCACFKTCKRTHE